MVFVDINTHSDSLLLFLECVMQKPSHFSLMSPGRQPGGLAQTKQMYQATRKKQEQTEWEGETDGLKRGTRGHGGKDGATRASWGEAKRWVFQWLIEIPMVPH